MNLTEEDKALIDDLITTDYWDVILKVLALGVEQQRDKLMSTDIEQGDRALALARARVDGARTLEIFCGNFKNRKKK